MAGKILISTAYLAPVGYFSRILDAAEVFVEREENYLKQTYRNRCYILSARGAQALTVPVYLGSFHKTALKNIRIDYSKRWQQVHLRAISASYGSSPFFEFYFEGLENIILKNHEYLLDLNTELTYALLKIIGIDRKIEYTGSFTPAGSTSNDFRYSIRPGRDPEVAVNQYMQVFNTASGFVPGLSIIDLIFNKGPESVNYLAGHIL